MHILAILKFIDDHPIAKTEDLTTSEINSKFVKPEKKGTNQSYSWKYVDLKDETSTSCIYCYSLCVSMLEICIL